jgi:pyrimidine dimer DNA glycosylase
LHPRYLDPQGLVALWREALLARAVLGRKTRGYRHHPQVARFRAHPRPRAAISTYLAAVHAEAERRGYAFDAAKIGPEYYRRWRSLRTPDVHPLMRGCAGGIEPWERA